MAFGHSCSIFHCITRFVLTTRDAILNANSFCTLQYHNNTVLRHEKANSKLSKNFLRNQAQRTEVNFQLSVSKYSMHLFEKIPLLTKLTIGKRLEIQ